MLRIFLTPPAAAVLDPVVDALVEQRVELALELLKAVQDRDERKIAQLTLEAYLHLQFPLVQACALIPEGAIREATCGNLGKLIHFATTEVGDTVVDTVQDIADIIGIDIGGEYVSECGRAVDYYTKHYVSCYHHGAEFKMEGKFDKLQSDVNYWCRNHYQRCHTRLIGSSSERLNEICNPLRTRFGRDADELTDALHKAVAVLGRAFPQHKHRAAGRRCDAGEAQEAAKREFVPYCIAALRKQPRFIAKGGEHNCRMDGKRLPAARAIEIACDGVRVNDLRVVCEVSPEPCRDGMIGTQPRCRCPDGQELRGDRCLTPACEGGKIGTPPDCRCPSDEVWRGGRCVAVACPAGMAGAPPDCVWPRPTRPPRRGRVGASGGGARQGVPAGCACGCRMPRRPMWSIPAWAGGCRAIPRRSMAPSTSTSTLPSATTDPTIRYLGRATSADCRAECGPLAERKRFASQAWCRRQGPLNDLLAIAGHGPNRCKPRVAQFGRSRFDAFDALLEEAGKLSPLAGRQVHQHPVLNGENDPYQVPYIISGSL